MNTKTSQPNQEITQSTDQDPQTTKPKIRVKMFGQNQGLPNSDQTVANNPAEGTKKHYEEHENYNYINNLNGDLKLNTVCQEANCPNVRECWGKKHASFMILGSVCTRKCSFCNIATGKPTPVDPKEPIRVAMAVQSMGLKHVVITSVDRDDLPDGGANHFAETIHSIRSFSPTTTIEVLTPDFLNKGDVYKTILDAKPDVYNHNIETVPSLYRSIRPVASYFNSLSLLRKVKEAKPDIFTKSGFMVGLGETDEEVFQLMDDMRQAQIDFITIGQYLRPTEKHAPVKRYVNPQMFEMYKKRAQRKGFLMVASSALTRSSYHADEHFLELKAKREGA